MGPPAGMASCPLGRQALFPQRGMQAGFCRTPSFFGSKPWRHLSIHFQWGAQVLISAALFYSQTGFNSTSNLLISLIFLRRKS
jgi:hypothetical protein